MAGSWDGTTYTGDDSAENVTGTSADEIIWTGLGKDVIRANGGNDTVDSGLDSDNIFGGNGDDILYDLNSFDSSYTGLVGKDTLYGGAGNDTLWFNSVDSSDIGDGGDGTDRLVVHFDWLGASTSLPVSFTLGATTAVYVDGILGLTALNFERVDITTSNGDDILTGGALDDIFHAGGGNDTVSGQGGNDLIDVGTGNFAAFGGNGTDTLVLNLSLDGVGVVLALGPNVSVNTGTTSGTAKGFEQFMVTTGGQDDNLTGAAGNDSLNGGDGNDLLSGGDGNDLLTLGLGAGTAYGGKGDDRIAYSNSIFSATPDPGDLAYGGVGNDTINFAKGGNNTGYGGDGNDMITVLSDSSTYATANTLDGGNGDDSLGGGNGADHIFGGSGNDFLSAYPRVQEILAGTGDDLIIVNGSVSDPVAAGQVLDGGAGTDRLNWTGSLGGLVDLTGGSYTTGTGSAWTGFESFGLYVSYSADLTLTFGEGNDRLDGGGFSSTANLDISGGKGDDTLIVRTSATADLDGGAGNDHLTSYYGSGGTFLGGTGNDFLAIYDIGGSTLNGGLGSDVAVFNTSVVADLAAGTAVRGAKTDSLIGIEGLTGSSSSDTLKGDGGDNQIYGGGFGSDVITTRGGADTIGVVISQTNTTHVTDFNHASDRIGLSGFIGLPAGAIDPARLVFGSFASAPTATIAGPEFFYDQSNGNLWMDRDGTGAAAAALVLVLDNLAALDASDLVVGDYFFR